MKLEEKYNSVRNHTELICKPLQTEDYVVQPIVDVSPPKWHLGHTTWFFENFVLKAFVKDYKEFNPLYNYVFNSYYETLGARVIRTDRGNLSRPSVEEVYSYRKYVDEKMNELLKSAVTSEKETIIILGLNHEQQHQELLMTDIKYILGHNPLFPPYSENSETNEKELSGFIKMTYGLYEVGFEGEGFCWDNELSRHYEYFQDFEISKSLVTVGEYLEFIKDGGYSNFTHWHSDGWAWVQENKIVSPMYWHIIDNEWHEYTLSGLQKLNLSKPVCHVSFYEASAYAAWKGMRLPTEFEWEIAAPKFKWGKRWEWTNSAYLPYPGFKKAAGAIGEYNGKFMINQMVLRGASEITPKDHSRITYRNFFQPNLRWQYTGIRLVK
ncbi:MAG: ergothioneine biosynthesis protein EgtB [Ferruginibacter sp.]